MRAAAKDAGRDPDAIEVSSGGGLDLDTVKRYADLGVSRFIVPPLGFDLDTLRTQLGRFSDTVIAHTACARTVRSRERAGSDRAVTEMQSAPKRMRSSANMPLALLQ